MRIAQLIHGLGLGGAQKVVESIVRNRRDSRISYYVFASLDGNVRRDIEDTGAKVRIIERRVPKLDLGWVRKLRRQLIRDDIQLVHSHLFGDSLHGYLAAKSVGLLPMVITLHNGPDGMNILQKLGYRWLIRSNTKVIACSDNVRRSVLDRVAAAGSQIQVIQNGIAREFQVLKRAEIKSLRSRLGFQMNDIVVGTFGRLEEQKGHAVLIEAFSKLVQTSKKSNLRLAIFGEGSQRKALQHQAAAEGLLDHTIKFAGFVPNATEFLQATDVFALSSFYEGLPISLLEAMRAGKCIVATDIPGISEAVRHQEEALLVSAGDADSLCSGLEQLIHSESRRRRLGMRARATFIEHFTEDEMCRKYEEIYTDLAARSLPLHVSEPRVPRQ